MFRIVVFVLALVLMFVPQAGATVQFFSATGTTGGGLALDGIDGNAVAGWHEALADGDVAFVVTTGFDACIYVLDADASCTESTESPCPEWIKPDTNPGTKCWRQTDLNGAGITTLPSAEPATQYRDSDATAGDINCRSFVDCTDEDNNEEDCDWTLACQVNGVETNKIVVDADGDATVTGDLVATGAMMGAKNIVTTTDGTESPTAAQMYNTMFIADHDTATSDTDYTLPGAVAGMHACFYDRGGGDGGIIIDAAAGDEILLYGAGVGAADAIDSPGVAGAGPDGNYICIEAIDATYWVTKDGSGTWVDGGAD